MKFSATLKFPYSREMNIVLEKLNIKIKDRVTYDIKKVKEQLIVEIRAKDITALRTAINALLRNVKAVLDAQEIR